MSEVPAKILEAVRNAAPEGEISCVDAHSLAEQLGVEIDMIGKALDKLKIKISDCELGCF